MKIEIEIEKINIKIPSFMKTFIKKKRRVHFCVNTSQRVN